MKFVSEEKTCFAQAERTEREDLTVELPEYLETRVRQCIAHGEAAWTHRVKPGGDDLSPGGDDLSPVATM